MPTHPDDWDAAAYLRQQLDGAPRGVRYDISTGPTWAYARPEGAELPPDGWKLHISSRVANYAELIVKLLPVLLDEGCHFKCAMSTSVLATLNSGIDSPATVGKAVTIYPRQSRVRALGVRLSDLLDGHEGPRILSDRRIRESAPVYYRFGPFVPIWYAVPGGSLTVGIRGPHGEMYEGAATLTYSQPEWVDDPFTDSEIGNTLILGERYRVTCGLHQAARGNVFRAMDTHAGQPVVIKQARAHVEESQAGADARMRLRNERHVLARCADLAGVPTVIDHFAHGDDEYLVLTDAGEVNLATAVIRDGPYLPPDARPLQRNDRLAVLASELARIVASLHSRDIIMRDVKPQNVVLSAGRPTLVDFGIAATPEVRLTGGTPGFACAEQFAGGEPRPAHDGYSLGMLLVFAATGLSPVEGISSDDLARNRMHECLVSVYGNRQPAFVAFIDALLSGDDARTASALHGLSMQNWTQSTGGESTRALDTGQRIGSTDVRDLEQHVLGATIGYLDEHVLGDLASPLAAVDACVYTGSAGIGLVLLGYRDRPEVARELARVSGHVAEARRKISLPAGLFTGATGVDVFTHVAAKSGVDVGELPVSAPGSTVVGDIGYDALSGVAGVGLGSLALAASVGGAAYSDEAARCARLVREKLRHDPTMPVPPGLSPSDGVDASAGYAHGLAGLVDFLVSYAPHTDDPTMYDAARSAAQLLRERADELISKSRMPTAIAMTASWCQGLTGVARTLLHAADVLADSKLRATAVDAALACAHWVPRIDNPGQCCGLAGVGSMLVDVAVRSGDDRCWTGAYGVVKQLLLRNMGSDDEPVFVDPSRTPMPLSWASGMTGVLAFLSRLSEPTRPDPVRDAITR